MDNFALDITAHGDASLQKAIDIAFSHNSPPQNVESYQITSLFSDEYNGLEKGLDGRIALIFRWNRAEALSLNGPVNLPFKLDRHGAVDFALRWLAEAAYGPEPDHDGHNIKGWRLFTLRNGRNVDVSYAICAIIPAWAEMGK